MPARARAAYIINCIDTTHLSKSVFGVRASELVEHVWQDRVRPSVRLCVCVCESVLLILEGILLRRFDLDNIIDRTMGVSYSETSIFNRNEKQYLRCFF